MNSSCGRPNRRYGKRASRSSASNTFILSSVIESSICGRDLPGSMRRPIGDTRRLPKTSARTASEQSANSSGKTVPRHPVAAKARARMFHRERRATMFFVWGGVRAVLGCRTHPLRSCSRRSSSLPHIPVLRTSVGMPFAPLDVLYAFGPSSAGVPCLGFLPPQKAARRRLVVAKVRQCISMMLPTCMNTSC